MDNLFERISEIARPENSPAPKDELTKKAEKECALVLLRSNPHFSNYVLMYKYGYIEGQIKEKTKEIQSLLKEIES